MFATMQAAFSKVDFRDSALRLQKFLSRFDAIFTLNQDTFLETHYAGPVRWSERWYGSYLPYMRIIDEPRKTYRLMLCEPLTQENDFVTQENYQPIYKLHGSYNWFSEPKGERLLVMGGNKTGSIKALRVLARYQDEFCNMLSQPDTHLMVIGYSFRDPHINNAIQSGAEKGMKVFVIDPLGVDVIDKREARTQPATDFMRALMPKLIGGSRRQLEKIINSDPLEHDKVMRFFDGQPHIVRIAGRPT
jgi:hypothetical protein